jgi:hypothetical protein
LHQYDRNLWLKADIVEALQVLRMLYNRDLMFREPSPSSTIELEVEKPEPEGQDVGAGSQGSTNWALDISDLSESGDNIL